MRFGLVIAMALLFGACHESARTDFADRSVLSPVFFDPGQAELKQFVQVLESQGIEYRKEESGTSVSVFWRTLDDEIAVRAYCGLGIVGAPPWSIGFLSVEEAERFAAWARVQGFATQFTQSYGDTFVVWREDADAALRSAYQDSFGHRLRRREEYGSIGISDLPPIYAACYRERMP